ncbi:MAG: serine/threonine protein kinase [Myxococcales bacterium]|nr:serine/threonine protein kinase [Myxococcales bacterium]
MSGGHGNSSGLAPGGGTTELLARFAPVRALGHGVLGRSYLAIQRGGAELRRFAVLKEVAPADAHAAAELLERCRVAAYVEHHNVAHVLDLSPPDGDGRVRVAYEYVVGESLLSLLAAVAKLGQPVPAALAVRMVADCCAGLSAAHDGGDPLGRLGALAHGALRPSNVLVSYAGCVKVVDVGLAEARGEGWRGDGESGPSLVAAQAHFMAPEQLAGAPPSPVSDVYSAGVLLYTLLTLRYPHDAHESVEQVGRAKLEGTPVPPTLRNEHVQPELERIILRALEPDPSMRQHSASELVSDLEGFAQRRQSTANMRSLADYLHSMFPQREHAKRKALRGLLSMPTAAAFAERTTVDVFDANLSQPAIVAEAVLAEPPPEPLETGETSPTGQLAASDGEGWLEGTSTMVDMPLQAAPSSLEICDDDVISYRDADDLDDMRTERSAEMSDALDGRRPFYSVGATEPPDPVPPPPEPLDSVTRPPRRTTRPPGGGVFNAPTRASDEEAMAAASAERRVRSTKPKPKQQKKSENLTPEPALTPDVPEGTTVQAKRDDSWFAAEREKRRQRRGTEEPTAVAASRAPSYGADDQTAVSLEVEEGGESRADLTQRDASEERTEVGPNPNKTTGPQRRR